MGETTEISVGSDWCTLQIAQHCNGVSPNECIFLDDKVRACRTCLRELIKDEYAEEFEWTLKETWHDGKCKTVSIEFDSEEEVTFCPKCLLCVMLRHDPEALDWVLIFHDKHHSGPKFGVWQGLGFPQAACRECLLIALYQVDPNFFRLLTERGEDLLKEIMPGAFLTGR